MKDAPQDRRERLLEAADCLFARWGLDKTSVDDIAREAGVSKGAVYLEFPDKDALTRAVVMRAISRYIADWLRRFSRDTGGWTFSTMMRHSIAAVNQNPLMQALVTRDQRIYGRFLREHPDLLQTGAAMRTDLFRQLQELGAIRADIPAPALAYLMGIIDFGLACGAEVMPVPDRPPLDETLHALGLLLDRGLSPRRVRNRQAARALVMSMMQDVRRNFDAGALPASGARRKR